MIGADPIRPLFRWGIFGGGSPPVQDKSYRISVFSMGISSRVS